MKIDGIADPREHRGNDEGLALLHKSHMAHKRFIEDLIDSFAIVDGTLRLAD
jgi:hypothetical protein